MNEIYDIFEVTLGPKRRNIVLERKYGSPKNVNDGVVVAKEVRCRCELYFFLLFIIIVLS